MIKIIKPQQDAIIAYTCDASGIEMVDVSYFDKDKPLRGCTIILNNNYGAQWDGFYHNEIHLSEAVTKDILSYLINNYPNHSINECLSK